MNIFQFLLYKIFDRQYVLLTLLNGDAVLKHAYKINGKVFSHPYLPRTRCELLPKGKLSNSKFILEWYPVTDLMIDYFNKEEE